MALPWSTNDNLDRLRSGEPFALRNARLPACVTGIAGLPAVGDGLVAADLVVADGRVDWFGAPGRRGDLPAGPDLDRGIVLPCPLDCHVHLDKGQVWARSPNPDGRFGSAGTAAHEDFLQHPDRDDVRRRAAFQLDCAHAHGTRALRSHVDADPARFDLSFEVLSELAADWGDRLTVQLAPFTGPAAAPDWINHLATRAASPSSGVLSAYLYTDPDLDGFVDGLISRAERHGLALDFHADETLDPDSHCLRAVAEAVLRTGFQGRVLVGHCCALSVQTTEEMERTLDLVAEAKLTIVSLPLTNAYLQDRREDASPRYRGHAPVREMRQRGIPVAIASDNARDPFHAYGDLDMVELFRDAVRIMQLDHPVADWPAALTAVPADALGLSRHGHIAEGAPADLMLFRARTWSEFVARPQNERLVLRAGLMIDTRAPDYRALDDLKGLLP